MSYRHYNEFERIKQEHDEVVALLKSLAAKGKKAKPTRKDALSSLPSFDPKRIEAAVVTANNAYALLLIATAEGFMRSYLETSGITLGAEPKLSVLIDRCRKEFNKTSPRIPIRAIDANALHDLREQRNHYAHGYGAGVFPAVGYVVMVLGKFFEPMS